ncbi:MAG: ATP-binding protein [Chitinophagaceae bacterium]
MPDELLNEDIEQKNAIMAAIIDSSEDAIISKDLSGIIRSWNRAAERMFGYKEADIIGSHISILIPDDRRSEEDMIISNLKQGKRVEHYETIRKTKTGEMLNISLTVSPIRNSAGVITGASKIARDITKQKRAEELQKKNTENLESINKTTRAVAAEIEEEKILQLVTDDTTRLCGAAFGAFFYNKKDARGESFMLFTLSGAPREAFEKFGMPRNTAVFSTTFNGVGILRSDDITADPRYGKNSPHHGMPKGHLPVISYLAVPVIAPSGGVIGGLLFGHPARGKFTADHEVLIQTLAGIAAVALEKARLYEEIKTLNFKKDEFISFASHELKTPLTTIKGYLELATHSPGMVNVFLPKINKQADRLNAIIADLLDVSKIHAGTLARITEPVNINNLIRESVETARGAWPHHIFHIEMPGNELHLFVDAQKLGQVLINLLTNAAKFSPEKTEITIASVELGDMLRISVTDKGIGIPVEELDRIFGRFYRVGEKGPRTDGLGLGLYISREIVEAHQGRIWATSEVGKGSVFTLEIPLRP